MSLRARLLLALVALLAVGLSLGSIGTHLALESYLHGKLDQEVRDAHPLLERTLLGDAGLADDSGAADEDDDSGTLTGKPGGGGTSGASRDGRDLRFGSAFLVGTYGAVYDAAGHLLIESSPGPGGELAPTERPAVTPQLLATAPRNPRLATVPLWTVPAQGHGDRFRMLAERFASGDVFVVAVPYSEMDATLDRADQIALIANCVAMVSLAALAYLLIRVGLRPLTRIEHTADEIALGDLTKRVSDTSRRTEVGRLGQAFNAMLSQIETAFGAREASEQRLRRFVADASHELRTPLTSIRGYAEMFDRGAANRPEDLAMLMSRIQEESNRMSGLVDDLLLLARLDQSPEVDRHPVDVAALVRDVVADARAVAPDRTIEAVTPHFLEIDGDESRLRQAVGNLVRNALVHTPPQSAISVAVLTEPTAQPTRPQPPAAAAELRKAAPTVGIQPAAGATPTSMEGVDQKSARLPVRSGRAAPWAGAGDNVTIAVVDHGPGVPDEAVEHIFERFYRADPGRSRDAGGTGLGLSIVAAVAAAHGGDVSYEPTPGGGATFRLTLPTT